jgi:hypothetical protein
MKKLLTLLLACAIPLFAAPNVNDVKVSQATSSSPPAYADRFITPTTSSLWGFNASLRPVSITLGTNLSFTGTTLNDSAEPSFTILPIAKGGTSSGTVPGANRALITPSQIIPDSGVIDWSAGNIFKKSLAGDITLSFSNAVDGQMIVIKITGNGHAVTWPAMEWANGTVPAQGASHPDVYTIIDIDGIFSATPVQNMH